MRAASESFKNVDNLTVLNGAQGMGEIIAQVIGQAGPALQLARDTLSTNHNGHGNGSSSSSKAARKTEPATTPTGASGDPSE